MVLREYLIIFHKEVSTIIHDSTGKEKDTNILKDGIARRKYRQIRVNFKYYECIIRVYIYIYMGIIENNHNYTV